MHSVEAVLVRVVVLLCLDNHCDQITSHISFYLTIQPQHGILESLPQIRDTHNPKNKKNLSFKNKQAIPFEEGLGIHLAIRIETCGGGFLDLGELVGCELVLALD